MPTYGEIRTNGIIQGKCRKSKSVGCATPPAPGINPFVNPANTGATGDGGASFTATAALGSNIPVAFGWVGCGGLLAGANATHTSVIDGEYRDLIFALSKGPVENIEDEDIFEGFGNTASAYPDWAGGRAYLALYDKKTGAFAQTAPAHYATNWDGSGSFVQEYPGVAHLTICVHYLSPGPVALWTTLPNIAVWLSGFNRVYDPRGKLSVDGTYDGGAGYYWSDNPATILACVMTNPDWGGKIPIADLDMDSLDAAADYCDEWLSAGADLTITNAVVASSKCTITTSAAHGLYPGDTVYISGVVGTIGANINGKYWRVRKGTSTTTFNLAELDMTYPDTAGWGTYTSDGTAAPKRKRYALNLRLARTATLESWVETIKAHAGLHVIRVGDKYFFYSEKATASSYTFTEDHALVRPENQTYEDINRDTVSEITEISYYGTKDAYYGYPTADLNTVRSPQETTTENEADNLKYQLEGCTNEAQAQAVADLIQNKEDLEIYQGTMEASFEGYIPAPMDVITIDDYLDLTDAGSIAVRVQSVAIRADRSCEIKWRWYDEDVYP